MKKIFNFILDFIFPPSCPVCGGRIPEHGMLCADCWKTFNWISEPKCHSCGYPFPADLDLGPTPLCPFCASGENEVDFMRAACVYDDASKNIMLPFKHAAKLKFQTVMTRAMKPALREIPTSVDLVIPVPLSTRRLFKRGYNQAALLGRPIAKHLNVPMETNLIKRKHRRDMGHMTFKQRHENIRGVFNIPNPDRVRGKTILLVDDVMTSGATFGELNRVLKRAGATAVYGIVFCRVVRAI